MDEMSKFSYMRKLIEENGATYYQGVSRDRITFKGEDAKERSEDVFGKCKRKGINVYSLHHGIIAETDEPYSEFQYS